MSDPKPGPVPNEETLQSETEKELLGMKKTEFELYQSSVSQKMREAQNVTEQKELLNNLFNIEAKREQRLSIPAMLLTQAVLLKFAYPEWCSHYESEQTESEELDRIKVQQNFFEELRRGKFPEDWTEILPYQEKKYGLGDQADGLWGHGGRKIGNLLRSYFPETDSPDASGEVLKNAIIRFISGGFLEQGRDISPYSTGDFGLEKNITEEQIREVADEIGLDAMARGELPETQQSSE